VIVYGDEHADSFEYDIATLAFWFSIRIAEEHLAMPATYFIKDPDSEFAVVELLSRFEEREIYFVPEVAQLLETLSHDLASLFEHASEDDTVALPENDYDGFNADVVSALDTAIDFCEFIYGLILSPKQLPLKIPREMGRNMLNACGHTSRTSFLWPKTY
jgi:hypothetical protein